MLKFISISNDENYEKTLLNEFNITSVSNISEFLSKIHPSDFVATFGGERMSICKNKILLLFTLACQKSFEYTDINRAAFKNIIEVMKIITGISGTSDTNSQSQPILFGEFLVDLFNILEPDSEFKIDLVEILIRNENFFVGSNKFACVNVERMLSHISRENFAKENLVKILSLVKNFEVFREPTKTLNLINMRIREIFNFHSHLITSELLRIYFYIIFNNSNINNFKIDLEPFSKLLDKFELSESSFVLSVINLNLDLVLDSHLEEFYGKDASKIILIICIGENMIKNAKLRIIYNLLNKSNKREISFDNLYTEFKLTIEDIEDSAFEAYNLQLFDVGINYSQSLIRIRYIRKLNYDKEYLSALKDQTANLRSSLKKFVTKIDSLIISQ